LKTHGKPKKGVALGGILELLGPKSTVLVLDVSSTAIGIATLHTASGRVDALQTVRLKGGLATRLAGIATVVGRLAAGGLAGLAPSGLVIESPIPARGLLSIRACYGAWGAAVAAWSEQNGGPVWCVFPSSWLRGRKKAQVWAIENAPSVGEDSQDAFCIARGVYGRPDILNRL
jgi:hypothetical protein